MRIPSDISINKRKNYFKKNKCYPKIKSTTYSWLNKYINYHKDIPYKEFLHKAERTLCYEACVYIYSKVNNNEKDLI